MRFALISNNAFSVLNFRAALLGEIVGRGHEVFALAPDFTDDLRARLKDIGVTAVDIRMSRTGLNPLRDASDIPLLARTLRRLNLDAVLSFAIKPVIYGTLTARMVGIPHRHALIAGLGYAFGDHKKSAKRTLVHHTARLLYTLALRQAETVFMQNRDDLEEFARLRVVRRQKMVLVDGTGVELGEWPVLPLPAGPPVFLLAARLLTEKGVRDYVEAARVVKRKTPEARFILLGGIDPNPDGISRVEVEGWVKDKIVEWPGHVEIQPWLAQSSVYVLPSYYREGIPRSIQEALASGRPVITADTPGCRETVLVGQNGFLVPPRDPTHLATVMQRYIDDPALVAQHGAQSRLLAEGRFDVRRVNARMISSMGL